MMSESKRSLKASTWIDCPICGSDDSKRLFKSRSAKTLGVITPISICRKCGFVFVNPRWTREQYNAVMDLWYPSKFEQDPQQKVSLSQEAASRESRFTKWRIMHERIASHYPEGISSVLDVGAGQGWCIEYLKEKYPAITACAVERWPECRKNIEEMYGAELIGHDVMDEWNSEYEGSFELIVFRHTLEHLLDPKGVLMKIRRFLSEDGMLYVVVPSIQAVNRPMLNDYFRPTHLSYFCVDTLAPLLAQCGFRKVVIREKGEGEAWGLFCKGDTREAVPNVYSDTFDMLNVIIRRERITTLKSTIRIKLMAFLAALHLLTFAQRIATFAKRFRPRF